jgi:hypothetical protein
MCLSLTEWRELCKIDKTVSCSDPRLASLLAIFTRLAASEAMPDHERLRYRGSQIWAAVSLALIAVLKVISQVPVLAARMMARIRAHSRLSPAGAATARSVGSAPPGAAL